MKWRLLCFLHVNFRWSAEVMASCSSFKKWLTVCGLGCSWICDGCHDLDLMQYSQAAKTHKWFKILCLKLLASSCFVLLWFNSSFALFFWRNNHSVDNDDTEHQCKTFTAKSILCYCHGLVHSGLLCLCVLCSYWVCCCQLFY